MNECYNFLEFLGATSSHSLYLFLRVGLKEMKKVLWRKKRMPLLSGLGVTSLGKTPSLKQYILEYIDGERFQ